MPAGRPSLYTTELGDILCERVVMRSLHAVSADDDMPEERTIYNWLRTNEDFFQNYMRARSIRAFRRSEQADDLSVDMRNGTIDASVARVELDRIKWQTGRENPKAFGERLDMSLNGTLTQQSEEQLNARILALTGKDASTG